LVLGLNLKAAWTQEVTERERLEEELRREELEPTALPEQRMLYEYGGWLRTSYSWFDHVPDEMVLDHYDLRLWGSLNIDQTLFCYVRIRTGYVNYWEDRMRGRGSDVTGPNLDMGFVSLDLDQALKKYADEEIPWDVRAQFGRQFFDLGRGLVMRDVQDGGQFQVRTKNWKVKALGSRSIRSRDNVDRSVPGFTDSYRVFAGTQWTYTGFDRHDPYVYYLDQFDRSDERPEDPAQEYWYDSRYVGLGSTGELSRHCRYYAELSLERGESYAQGATTQREDVKAHALDLGLDYFFPVHTSPRVGMEWAYGSGDNDRGSVTNTVPGNQPNTIDTNYLYFGFIESGYSLAPRLSNLQFIRVGGTFRPLEGSEHFDRLQVGCNFFEYRKDEAGAPISDFRADVAHEEVGSELDFLVYWRIFHDLAFSTRYGVFYPGKAYTDRSSREFLIASLTYSF